MNDFAERHYRSLIIAVWLLTSLLFLFVARDAIADWKMGDPDDQLRLVQVRDWLAGQSWWDITQYRMNPPEGGPMHWSRLVDIPIAGMIVLLRLFMSPALAEQWACAIVPILTYGCVLWAFAATARRQFGAPAAFLAAATLFTILPATTQLLPMRIDHHGWQLFCFFLASWGLFDPKRSSQSAIIIGLALALWVEISIEGLPFAVIFAGVLGLRWLFPAFDGAASRQASSQFPIALATLATGSGFLYLITEGMGQVQNHCDGLSPFHIVAFSIVAGIIGGASLFAHISGKLLNLWARSLTGVLALTLGVALVFATAPQCAGDAFANLDPLVRQYWFNRTAEGLPLWAVGLEAALPTLIALGFGMIGILWLLWRPDSANRSDRIAMALLFIGCALVGSLVSRTMVYALCLATIMLAPLALALFDTANESHGLAKRMLLRVAAVILLFPIIIGQNVTSRIMAGQAVHDPKIAAEEMSFEKLARACQKPRAAALLNQLPSAQLMVGLDTSPAVLQFTHHKVVATGHHRNHRAMADVIRSFIGTEAQAKDILKRRNVRYLVTCEGSFELRVYRQDAPDGFWSRLRSGATPGWLVRQPDIGPFHIWRVDWMRE